MQQHPQFKGIVGIPKLVGDSEFVLRIPHLIDHPVDFLSDYDELLLEPLSDFSNQFLAAEGIEVRHQEQAVRG